MNPTASMVDQARTLRRWLEKFPATTLGGVVRNKFGVLRLTKTEAETIWEIKSFLRKVLNDMEEEMREAKLP